MSQATSPHRPDNYTYAQRLGGTWHTDNLIAALREGIGIAFSDNQCWHQTAPCLDCLIGTAGEVLSELLRTERTYP